MPRQPRGPLTEGVHHLFARGNAKEAIYRDDRDRVTYLELLARATVQLGWECLAYCLMTNHVHLLLESGGADLSTGMHRLHSTYAQAFNRRHDRTGHLFEHRFGSVRVESDVQLCVTAGYIARNPVDAGLCAAPEDWRWSSYAAAAGETVAPPWLASEKLLGYFSSRIEVSRKYYGELSRRAAPLEFC